MRISIKQLVNILNSENINYREKGRYFDHYYSSRRKAFLDRLQDLGFSNRFTKSEIKQRCLINLIKNKITHENIFVFWDDYDNQAWLDNCEPMEVEGIGTVSNENYHDNFNRCSDCESLVHNDDLTYMDTGEDICDRCYRDHDCYYCDDCEAHIFGDSDSCECRSSRGLNSDQDSPTPLYLGVPEDANKATSETYGIETELEVRGDWSRLDVVNEIRSLMNKEIDRVMCVRDGSLCQETGFEMVSTNATFDYHKNHFWDDFYNSNLVEKLRGYKGRATAIHIHFTRRAFSEHQLRHLNAFYHNPNNKDFLVDVAGRESEDYARFIDTIDYENEIEDTGYKYRAINFNNYKTVEVRIFKSNIKKISFFRNLELVYSVNQFIKTVPVDRTEAMSYMDYFDFLLNNPNKDYVNLLVWLDDKEYFSHLKHILSFKDRYESFKSIVDDFRENNSELIEQEREE